MFLWAAILVTVLLLALVIAKIVMSQTVTENFNSGPTFDFVLPIYIISLPIRKAMRLDPLLQRIKPDPRYSLEEVHAVDGAKDLIDDRETFLSRGQTGCWLSHAYFWRVIADRPEPFALILEDDAMIYLPDK